MIQKHQIPTLVLMMCIIFLSVSAAGSGQQITVVLYYSSACGACRPAEQLVESVVENYSLDAIVFIKTDVTSSQTHREEWRSYGFTTYPSIVINNETLIPKQNISRELLETTLDAYIEALERDQDTTHVTPFGEMPLILAAAAICLILLAIRPWRQSRKKP